MKIRFKLRRGLWKIIDSIRCLFDEMLENLIVLYAVVVAENHSEPRSLSGSFNRIYFFKPNVDVWFLCKTNLSKLSLC
jgi:hypothetical protein